MNRLFGRSVAMTLAVVTCAASTSRAQERSHSLERTVRARQSIGTAQIEWQLELRGPRKSVTYNTSRVAGKDLIVVNRGDEEGVVMRRDDGTPDPLHPNPHLMLVSGSDLWHYQERNIQAKVYPSRGECPDPRNWGLSYGPADGPSDEVVWRDPGRQTGAREYREQERDNLREVRARTDAGEIVWWLDPARGSSPVRVQLLRDGEVAAESRSTLKEFDGVWFPESIAYYSKGHEGGREPYQIVRVLAARINQPDQPKRLTPNDIGIEVGVNIDRMDDNGRSTAVVFWDGEKTISIDEYNRRVRAGELQLGAGFQREFRRLVERQEQDDLVLLDKRNDQVVLGARLTLRSVEGLWERYTQAFIRKYHLNADQTQTALTTLRTCQELAQIHFQKERQRVEAHLRDVQALVQAGGEADPDRIRKLQDAETQLLAPINEIFLKRLKPRLEKIPTSAQRRAVDAVPVTTRPTER